MIKYPLYELIQHLHPNKVTSIVAHIEHLLGSLQRQTAVEFSLENGPWLGGGCLRQAVEGKSCETDFDIFFKNADQHEIFQHRMIEGSGVDEIADNIFPVLFPVLRLKDNKRLFTKTLETSHVTNFDFTEDKNKYNIQLIHGDFFHDSVEHLLDSFDYTICQLATDGETIIVGDYTLLDIANKKLAVHKLTFPAASLSRAVKYGSYGYKMCNGEALKFLTSVVQRPTLLETRFAYID